MCLQSRLFTMLIFISSVWLVCALSLHCTFTLCTTFLHCYLVRLHCALCIRLTKYTVTASGDSVNSLRCHLTLSPTLFTLLPYTFYTVTVYVYTVKTASKAAPRLAVSLFVIRCFCHTYNKTPETHGWRGFAAFLRCKCHTIAHKLVLDALFINFS